MSLFQLTGALLALIVALGYLNNRFVKLPDTLGITAVGLGSSLLLLVVSQFNPGMTDWAMHIVERIDFPEVVFHGMLGILLFAGALHTPFDRLWGHMGPIVVLATVSVAISTFVIGLLLYAILPLFGFPIDLVYCLMFGALISPTDPIAVMAVIKGKVLPEPLHARLAGEGLFNDGTGVVAFITLVGLATGASVPSVGGVALMLVQEIIGALALGGVVGVGALLMLKRLESYPIEIMLTLTLATGGYALAEHLHVSAPIAVVIMGLVIGSFGDLFELQAETREHLLSFWELTDELLNLLIFGLIGIELLALDLTGSHLLIAALAIPVALLGRLASIWLPALIKRSLWQAPAHLLPVMTWGGLRGAISIALALSMPAFSGRDYLIAATYGVVIFSLLVQALTMGKLLDRLAREDARKVAASPPPPAIDTSAS